MIYDLKMASDVRQPGGPIVSTSQVPSMTPVSQDAFIITGKSGADSPRHLDGSVLLEHRIVKLVGDFNIERINT